jgi:hypothetical protein
MDALLVRIDQLLDENAALRAEITRLRLFQALDIPADEEPEEASASLPLDARKLYYVLPESFSQIAYFKMAHDLGFGIERSQTIIGLLMRQRFLRRAGWDRLCKTNPFQHRLPLCTAPEDEKPRDQ